MNLIQQLDSLPLISIYGFFNETDKKVYIGYTFDTILALHRGLRELKYSNKDYPKFEFKVIEPLAARKDIRLQYQKWVEYYSNMGYKMYRSYRAIQFKVSIDVIRDVSSKITTRYLFRVRLVTVGGLKRLVGLFETQTEMDEFLKEHYVSDSITNVVYCCNKVTKEYLARE